MSKILLKKNKIKNKKIFPLKNNPKMNKEEYISTESSPKKEIIFKYSTRKMGNNDTIDIFEEKSEVKNSEKDKKMEISYFPNSGSLDEDDYKTIDSIFRKHKELRKNKFHFKKRKITQINDLKKKAKNKISSTNMIQHILIEKNFQKENSFDNLLQKKRNKDDNEENFINEKFIMCKDKEQKENQQTKKVKDLFRPDNEINIHDINLKKEDEFDIKEITKSKVEEKPKFEITFNYPIKEKVVNEKKIEEIIIDDLSDNNYKNKDKNSYFINLKEKRQKQKSLPNLLDEEFKKILNEAQKRKESSKNRFKEENDEISNILKNGVEEIKIVEDKKDRNEWVRNSMEKIINLNNNNAGLNSKLDKKEKIKVESIDISKNITTNKESIIKIDEDSTDGNESDELEKFLSSLCKSKSNSHNNNIFEFDSSLNSLIEKYGSLKLIIILLLKTYVNNQSKSKIIESIKKSDIFNFEKYMEDKDIKINFINFKNRLTEELFSDYNSMINSQKNKSYKGMDLDLNLIRNNSDNTIPKYFRDKMHSIERYKGNLRKCMACCDDKKENKIDYFCNVCKIPIHPECFLKYHNNFVYRSNNLLKKK